MTWFGVGADSFLGDAKGFQEFNYGPDVVRACERELAVLAAA